MLGIFGKYGLDMGVFWPTDPSMPSSVPGNMAFEIYRNYDGNKSTFGDQELNSTTGDQSKLAVYAASRTSDGAVTIVVINKTYGSLTDTLSINNLVQHGDVRAGLPVQQCQPERDRGAARGHDHAQARARIPRTVSATSFPAQSITLIVIPSH